MSALAILDPPVSERWRRKKVLVIDGDPSAARGLERLLGTDGYEATSENDSALALAHLAREPFDAVVADIEMPGVGGVDLWRAVRAAHPRATLFVVTARGDARAEDEALAAGARRVFDKPIDYPALVEELRASA